MSEVRSSRVRLRGYGNTQPCTYQVGSVFEEASTVNKGQSSSNSSVGEKTLTQGSSSSPYQLDAARMRVLLVALRGNADIDLEKLSPTMKGYLNAIKQIHIGIDNESGRIQLNALIDEIFGDINDQNVIPNTVASFFRGCRMSNCNGISMGCTPHCANALPSDPNLTGYAPCDAAVYILKNGVLELSTHGSHGNSNAYVYVNSNFRGYTASMIRQLAQNGVRHVKTVHFENGKCGQISPDFIDVNILGGGGDNGCGDSGSWGGQWWWWVVLAILAVLIIALIWALVARGRSGTRKGVPGITAPPSKRLSTRGVSGSPGVGTSSAGGGLSSLANLGQSAPQNPGGATTQNIMTGLPFNLPQTVQSLGSSAAPSTLPQTVGNIAGSAAFSPDFFNQMSGAIGSPLFG